MNQRGQIFKTVTSGKRLKKNAFDLSFESKLTGDMANLMPIYLDELVPGDKFRGNLEMVIKTAPLIAPIYHRINAYVHYFAVPKRLLWDNWKTFITRGTDGKQAPPLPTIQISDVTKANFNMGSLPDYLGIMPVLDQASAITSVQTINALPFRAYQMIYNEYYRDQTLSPEIVFSKGDDAQTDWQGLTTLRRRQWEKDYFTSALPFLQRGDDVNIPMDIVYKDSSDPILYNADGGTANGALTASTGIMNDATEPVQVQNIEALEATINDLRTSITLQKWLEKNARAGSRYIEQILAHFNRRVPDYRLQRPEMIGGGKQTIMISEVLANFESETTAQGKMSGHGLSVGNQTGFNYTADEHCYIMGILSVIPRSGYMSGTPKLFHRKTVFDFYFPTFAHLGEEPIFNKELYTDYHSDPNINDGTFGYTPRYASYKYHPDTVHGEFRTNLEYWHLARKFSGQPLLNNSFTECSPDTRIFAVQDEANHKLWIQLYHNIRAIRPMPVYGTPQL